MQPCSSNCSNSFGMATISLLFPRTPVVPVPGRILLQTRLLRAAVSFCLLWFSAPVSRLPPLTPVCSCFVSIRPDHIPKCTRVRYPVFQFYILLQPIFFTLPEHFYLYIQRRPADDCRQHNVGGNVDAGFAGQSYPLCFRACIRGRVCDKSRPAGTSENIYPR